MDYIQFTTLMITMFGGFGFIYREFKNVERDLREDMKIQSKRSDELYNIIINLLKSKGK